MHVADDRNEFDSGNNSLLTQDASSKRKLRMPLWERRRARSENRY